MALTLAACGSDDETTTTTETTTTVTPTPTPEPVGETSTLTDATAGDTVVGTAGDDVINATTATLGAADTIVDQSSTDSDTLNVTVTGDLDVAPRISGIENINITSTATTSGGNTTLDVNVASLVASSYSFDVNNAESLVATVSVTNADSGHYTASGDFADVDIAADTDADIEVTIGADATVTTTGAADDLTVHGGGFDVTIDASAATEDLVVDGAVDADVTAASVLGNVSVTSSNDLTTTTAAAEGNITASAGRDVTLVSAAAAEGNITVTAGRDVTNITAASAEGDVTVTAGRDVAAMSVAAAEGTVTVTAQGDITVTTAAAAGTIVLDNTGAEAGDDVTLTNGAAATTVTITSVGAVTANANAMAAVTNLTVTAAEASTIDADGATDNQAITLNAAEPDGDAIAFTLAANDVETLTLGGSSAIIVSVDSADISTETVASTNAVSAMLDYTAASAADLTNVASNVVNNLGADFDNITLTVDSDTNIQIDTEVNQTDGTAEVIFDHETDATATTNNTLTISVGDSNTANATADATATVDGLTFTDIQTLTVALGEFNIDFDDDQDLNGADLETVIVTGTGTFDLNTNTIVGDATNRVTLDASALEGVLTMNLDGTTNGVAVVSAGTAADAITIDGVSGATTGFDIDGNAGNDVVTVTTNGDGATAIIDYNGGTGGDQIVLNAGVDISDSTVTLTSVEQITLVGGGADQLVSSALVSGKAFVIAENGTGAADLEVVVDSLTVDLSSLVFDASFASGTDNTIVNGSGNASSMTITGSAADDVITGGSGADTITAGGAVDTITGGAGADTINLTESTAAADILIYAEEAANADTVTGFTADAADDVVHIDVSAINGAALSDTAGTAMTAGDAHSMIEYTVGSVLASNTAGAAFLKVTNTTGIDEFADVSTAIDANNITFDASGGAFAAGEGILTIFYDADDGEAVLGYMESDAADVFDDGNTFVEITSLVMSTAEYDAFSAANVDFV